MEEFNIEKKETLTVGLYGETYKLSRPTVKQQIKFERSLSKTDKDLELSLIIEYVKNLGMPQDVLDEMQADHFVKLLEYIGGKGKKK